MIAAMQGLLANTALTAQIMTPIHAARMAVDMADALI
jgi:hypothetical protein